jgi:hypothetical protein
MLMKKTQVIIVSAVGLFVQDISNEANGLSRNRSKNQYRFSRKQPTKTHRMLMLRRTLHSILVTPGENRYLGIEDKHYELILSMDDQSVWMMINQVHQQYQALQLEVQRTADYQQSHTLSKRRHR